MQPSNDQRSEQNRGLLMMLVFAFAFMILYQWMFPPQPPAEEAAKDDAKQEQVDGDDGDKAPDAKADDEETPGEESPIDATVERDVFPRKWITLGSVDPESDYRMLVTLTTRGAALMRAELSADSYRDTEDRTGYLGQIVVDESVRGDGCPVQVVGHGTPAEKAGLEVGDLIKEFNGVPITGFDSLRAALLETKPGDTVEVKYTRDGAAKTTTVDLLRRPVQLIGPERLIKTYADYDNRRGLHGYVPDVDDPLSMLMTLQSYDAEDELPQAASIGTDPTPHGDDLDRDETLSQELGNLRLRSDDWELVPSDDEDEAIFRYPLPNLGLEIVKTYRLALDGSDEDPYGGYHLDFDIEIRNVDDEKHKVAYLFDGPNGLPTEGAWYARKTGPGWGTYGLRDVIVKYEGASQQIVAASRIGIRHDSVDVWTDNSLRFIGVDGQYFSAVLMPRKEKPEDVWFDSTTPIRVGGYNANWKTVTNTSARMVSLPSTLEPSESLKHSYRLFAGPKKPRVLDRYGLGDTICYGWPIFKWVAVPLQYVLHFLVSVVFSYGLAIIILTVIVRGLLHPMSRKQMLNAQKMQALQPEIKRLTEKFKKDPEGLRRAQKELFEKHNFNPLGGCGVMFIQLPIFIGLYRALQVDVELREASLFGSAVRWCSNLSAPDMLYDWSGMWSSMGWEVFNTGQGAFYLGPYLNLLPLVTVVLFQLQQMIMMPPPADEQARMQRNMMQFMMLFMGLIFFKVASGLCIYFIASSIWGLVEKQFLPKPQLTGVIADAVPAKAATDGGRSKPKPKPSPKKGKGGGRKK